jgi:D-alanyl-D-alanine carboxypeptidase/D-alanyl-D-alanine-endopeptidase (penicillin-binding protein 4)
MPSIVPPLRRALAALLAAALPAAPAGALGAPPPAPVAVAAGAPASGPEAAPAQQRRRRAAAARRGAGGPGAARRARAAAPRVAAAIAPAYVATRSAAELGGALGNLLSRREDGRWGVMVVSLTRGDTLFAREPDTPVVPASTMKMFTSVLAFDRLGPDWRFRTEALRAGPLAPTAPSPATSCSAATATRRCRAASGPAPSTAAATTRRCARWPGGSPRPA